MNHTNFQRIVNLIGPSIKKQETHWREIIGVEAGVNRNMMEQLHLKQNMFTK